YIPQIAAIMGNCAGGSSYSPAMCDFIFMVDKTGQFFITGPKVIKAVVGMDVTMEELGGASVHSKYSGQAHFVYQDDLACIEGIKELLEYLTEKKTEYYPMLDYRALGKEIEDIVPEDKRYPYDVKEVIKRLVDDQVFMEVLPEFAKNMVTGFARMEGRSIGIIANQANYYGGALDCDAADKCARFVRLCDCFDIPLLTLVDVPGYLPGIDQERKGILRHGSKILFSFAEATVPQVSLILRKAYGGAYCAMDSKALGCDFAFAWPICEFAVMGASGAVDVIYHKQIEQAEDSGKLRAELIKQYEDKYLDPYYAATCGMIDEVILPEETREKIILAFNSLEGKKVATIQKKHGNITL
ncbi:MAG: methylmalonyl-CoA carboxyltransferase, partial [Clostridia bacterium]|nr:methylmalonyl-CoA carboxyltransferase [Clostridia bacterium]